MKSQTSDISLWMNTTSPHEGGGLAGQRVTGNSGKFEILKEFLENLSLTGGKIANVGETLDAFFSDKHRNSYIRSIFPYSCFSRRDYKTHWRSSELILHPLHLNWLCYDLFNVEAYNVSNDSAQVDNSLFIGQKKKLLSSTNIVIWYYYQHYFE